MARMDDHDDEHQVDGRVTALLSDGGSEADRQGCILVGSLKYWCGIVMYLAIMCYHPHHPDANVIATLWGAAEVAVYSSVTAPGRP